MKQAFRFLLVLTWLAIGASFTSCDKDKPENDDSGTDPATIEMEHGYCYYRVTNTVNETVKFMVKVGSGMGTIIENVMLKAGEIYIFKVSTLFGSHITGSVYPYSLYSLDFEEEMYRYAIADMELYEIEIRKD